MKKIILTTHQFLPDHASGTEILTYSVAKELTRRGFSVTVFTGFPAKSLMPDDQRCDSYDIDGIQVVRFHHNYSPTQLQQTSTEIEYRNLLCAAYFKELLTHLKPNIVHFFHLSRLSSSLIDVTTNLGIPSYYTPTDFWSVCPTSQMLLPCKKMCAGPNHNSSNCVQHVAEITRTGIVKEIVRHIPPFIFSSLMDAILKSDFVAHPLKNEILALQGRSDFIRRRLQLLNKIIAPTELMFNSLLLNGVPREKLLLSAYGIDTSYYTKNRKTRRSKPTLRIGFIGTLAEHKGCHVLIDAINSLAAENYEVLIYGSSKDFPKYFSMLEAAASANKKIVFCGTFPNNSIGEILADLDVLVVPSIWYENTPLVIYSAMASGCPVVASDFPGMTEVVKNNVNGLTFPSNNSKALAECLYRLLNTPSLLSELSGNCLPPKSVETYVEELLELYDETPAIRQPNIDPENRIIDSLTVPRSKKYLMSGWVLTKGEELSAVLLLEENNPIASTSLFSPRPDVVSAYRKILGRNPTNKIGFNLSFDVFPSNGILQILTTKKIMEIPVNELHGGGVTNLDSQSMLGIDKLTPAEF